MTELPVASSGSELSKAEQKLEEEMTELAEAIYAFHLGNLTPQANIKAIKATIQSFLLSNHYVQLAED